MSEEVASVPAQVDFLWRTHSYLSDYIRLADTKGAFTVAFGGGTLGVVFARNKHFLFTQADHWGWRGWLECSTILGLVLGIGLSLLVLIPRTPSNQFKGYIFWTGIRQHGSGLAFWESIQRLYPSQFAQHLAEHAHALSGVAEKKYRLVRWSMLITTASCVGALILLSGKA